MSHKTALRFKEAKDDPKELAQNFVEWEEDGEGEKDVLMVEEVEDKEFPGTFPEKEKKKRGNTRRKTIITCEYCGLVIKYPSKIREHMRTHTGEKPFRCDICGMQFTQRTPMVNHFREHMNDLPYSCSYGCGKRFVNNARRNAHELRHAGMVRAGAPRPHLKPPKRLAPCAPPIVNETSNLMNPNIISSFLSNEEISLEFPEPIEELEVPEFPNDPTFPVYLEDDEEPSTSKKLEMERMPENAEYSEVQKRIDSVIESVLAKCLAPPPRIDETVYHPKMDQNVQKTRSYLSKRVPTTAQCSECGLMLKYPSKIAEHMRTHTGEKPFQCGECGMCLTKATSLRLHILRKHTNNRPFLCQWGCPTRFVSRAVRSEHEKVVHSGIKRYECLEPGCHNAFSRRAYLERHKKSMHRDTMTQIFDHVQVANEEAADVGANCHQHEEPMILYESGEQIIVLNEEHHRVDLNEPYDEEEFVEQAISSK